MAGENNNKTLSVGLGETHQVLLITMHNSLTKEKGQ